jgi:PAS domain S-box-containing protein
LESIYQQRAQADIGAIRGRITNGSLLVLSFFALPALAFSLFRMQSIGWQPVMGIHIGAAVAIWLTMFLRTRLPYQVSACVVVGLVFLVGIGGFLNFALSGAGLPFFVISVVLSSVLLGTRPAILMLLLGCAVIFSIGWAYHSEVFSLAVDLGFYSVQLRSWLTTTASLLFLGGGAIAAIVGLNKALLRAVSELNGYSAQLEKQVSARTQELETEIAERKSVEASLRVSEERYHNVINSQTELITQFTPEGRFIFVNDAYCRFVGQPEEKLIGASIYDVVPEEEVDGLRAYIASFSSERRHQTTQNHLTAANGEIRFFEWSNSASVDDQGEVIELQSVGRDITERMKAEQALLESEQRLSDYAGSASDWFWEMDENLRFVLVTDTVMQYNGGTDPRVFYGMTRQELNALNKDDSDIWDGHIADMEARRPFRNFEYSFVDGHGETHEWSISGQPFHDTGGRFCGYRGVGRDITDRVIAQMEIGRQRDELELLNQQKNKFFSIIAHDLKNPFGTIIGFADLIDSLGDKLSAEKMREMAGSISTTSHNVYQLLEDLLAWGRSQMGALSFEPGLKSCHDLFERGVGNLTGLAEQKGITFDLQAGSTEVYADQDLIVTVIRNLASNAIKFTPSGGRVTLEAVAVPGSTGEEGIDIRISDTGIGMDEDQISKLFGIDTSQSTKGTEGEPGTGLGLLLCKDFVEKHGGEISVSSEIGVGTTFCVRLPPTPTSPEG